MEPTPKVVILVSVQITLLIASFLVLVYFESQTVLAGNMVNIAGKNRVLASTVNLELGHAGPAGDAPPGRVLAALENFERNLYLLKDGGTSAGIEVPPLPPRFEPEWRALAERFAAYKGMIVAALPESGAVPPGADVRAMFLLGNEIIELSDGLTTSLGHDTERISEELILMQILLGAANVAAHLLMIGLIWNIFKGYAARQAKAERLAAVGELAAILAHDMKNPLGTIRNSMELLSMYGGLSEPAGRELSRVNRSVRRISHQVEEVLNHARSVPLVLELAPLLPILRRSADVLELPAHITLEMPAAGCELAAECDPEKIEIVFMNLLVNAVQAIGSRAGRITVRARDDGSHVVVEFENSGSHIPEEDMPLVFEPMFTTKMQGTGLGLTSCRNIVELHGGTISADSGEDLVTFTIRLPKRQGDGRGGGEQKEDSRDRRRL